MTVIVSVSVPPRVSCAELSCSWMARSAVGDAGRRHRCRGLAAVIRRGRVKLRRADAGLARRAGQRVARGLDEHDVRDRRPAGVQVRDHAGHVGRADRARALIDGGGLDRRVPAARCRAARRRWHRRARCSRSSRDRRPRRCRMRQAPRSRSVRVARSAGSEGGRRGRRAHGRLRRTGRVSCLPSVGAMNVAWAVFLISCSAVRLSSTRTSKLIWAVSPGRTGDRDRASLARGGAAPEEEPHGVLRRVVLALVVADQIGRGGGARGPLGNSQRPRHVGGVGRELVGGHEVRRRLEPLVRERDRVAQPVPGTSRAVGMGQVRDRLGRAYHGRVQVGRERDHLRQVLIAAGLQPDRSRPSRRWRAARRSRSASRRTPAG